MPNANSPNKMLSSSRAVAVALIAVAFGGFVGGWGYSAARGEGQDLQVMVAFGQAIGSLFASAISGGVAWLITRRVEPCTFFAFIVGGSFGGLEGFYAIHDAAWLKGAIAVMCVSVFLGLGMGGGCRLLGSWKKFSSSELNEL